MTLSPVERRVRGASLRACDGLIVASARERARLAADYRLSADRLHDVPNPVDTEVWRASPRALARAELGLPRQAFVVVNHGRIDIHRKGLDVLVEAWRRFSSLRPEARLVLIGSGQDHQAFGALLEGVAGVDWRSAYLTDPPQIRLWLSAADAYVSLSRIEGMPVAPLEALACGLPVVASAAHGLADIFDGGEASGGLLVAMQDAGAAADALQRLAADPSLRMALGAAARVRAEQRYGVTAVGEALAHALEPPLRSRSTERRRRDQARSGRALGAGGAQPGGA